MSDYKKYEEISSLMKNNEEKEALRIIKQGFDFNYNPNGKSSILSIAAFYGCEEIIKYMLKNNVDVYKRDLDGLSALDNAIISNKLNVVKILKSYFIEKDIYHSLRYAALKGYTDIVKEISEDTDLDDWVDNLFYLACLRGELDNVQYFHSKGANINKDKDGISPVVAAMKNKHQEVVNYLENNGAFAIEENDEVLFFDNSQWFEAVNNENPDVLRHLIAKGQDVYALNDDFESAFDILRRNNRHDLIQLIKVE